MNIWNLILQAGFLLLPAIVANSLPQLLARGPVFGRLNVAIDGGRTFRSKRLFGDNKTWRGLIGGSIGAIITILLQESWVLSSDLSNITVLDYSREDLWVIGFAMGFGALIGDLGESFLKRQINIAPGASWWPWDQLDATVGALVGLFIFISIPVPMVITILVGGPIFHALTNLLAYLLKIKEVPW